MSLILGLNAFHGDSSACVFRDGQLLAAAEEERFRRLKHWAGFPSEAIRYCLREAGAELADVAHIAINSQPRSALLRKLGFVLRNRPDPSLIWSRLQNRKKRMALEDHFAEHFPGDDLKAQVHRIEHHLCHLASAHLVSGLGDAVAVSVDGFGDFASAAWGYGRDGRIDVDERVYFPHSLGIFYQAITQHLGFPHYGDEYKMMGLAPYGRPTQLAAMQKIVRLHDNGGFSLDMRYFRHGRENVAYAWDNGIPTVGTLYTDALNDLLGPARTKDEPLTQYHKDLAHSAQKMYEQALFHLLNTLHRRYQNDHLALAGGCAMNSVANGKIRRNTPFKRVYVQAAAGDAGGAIGAAAVLASRQHGPAISAMEHSYWGPSFSDEEIAGVLSAHQDQLQSHEVRQQQLDEAALLAATSAAIADGKVIGWFQGRMEWGPRALGNRSILGDPRRADMKDILNLKIKRRESFRPFAPSILREAVSDWFEEDDDVPFMMKVFQIRAERRPMIPAVTHVDGSGRLQTVSADTNPRYHRLIEQFGRDTGVPILLNTSFNENEPVVCRPEEALDCFLRTNMDVLVMGNHFLSRPEAR